MDILLFVLFTFSVFTEARISSIYLFGDSLVDFGNNDDVFSTYAKADYLPYGTNFPGGKPTGRFTNGFLVPDFITTFLNIPFAQPYLSSSMNASQGVNFASGGSGLYNTTGNVFRLVPSGSYPRPMSLQVENFLAVKNTLNTQLGSKSSLKHLNDALFYITFGSNDIANNYFLDKSPLRKQYTISQFIDVLIQIYNTQLQILYQKGARKFVIASLFPLGCSPAFLIANRMPEPGRCFEPMNCAAKEFNCKLANMVSNICQCLPDTTFLYANSYDIPLYIVRNPQSHGFKVPNVGCCNFIGPGPKDNSRIPLCLPASPTCGDVSQYVYWDQFHPTSNTYEILANLFWNGSSDYIWPMNIQLLSSL